jgi:ABC-type dipeptide/oligopeptide/nickel transport system permease subunit
MSEHNQPTLHASQEAIRRNDFEKARHLLALLVKSDPNNEAAWLTLAKVVEQDDQIIYCLQQVVRINTDNQPARKWLESLKQKKLHGEDSSVGPSVQVHTPQIIIPTGETPAQAGTSSTRYFESEPDLQKLLPHRSRNWPLILGVVLFFLIAFLAVFGPYLAPRDPLEENLIIQVNGKWEVPPFEIFTSGFPLGSDEFGRDLLSRLLVGIRPTMVMVLVVAGVRLVLGTSIGVMAGWFNGRFGRGLDTLIEGALSIPVLLVALGAIAVVGVELGIWAFILGLSLTGWVETAQQVREQTRITKGQVFVEASHALGASNRQILTGHVLKQISPMMIMLLAFEMSSTLMATAGLGFLGYYIGGDVWIDVSDFVARRISGTPELGQMLATSWVKLTEPWAMVAVGTTVFTAVLAFNLLGEGFRQSLNLSVRRRGFFTRLTQKANLWLDQNAWYPLSIFLAKPAVRVVLAGASVLVLGIAAGSWLWPQIQDRLVKTEPLATQISQAGSGESQPNLPKASDQAQTGETQPSGANRLEAQVLWEKQIASGFQSGPVLSPAGDLLYVPSDDGILYAIDLDGQIQWQVELPAGGVGTPALGPEGEIYVSDDQAGLSAVSPKGELLWHFQSEAGNKSVAGPVTSLDGTIFYTLTPSSKGFVQAVSPDGEGLWATQAKTPSFFESPQISADGRYVFLKNDIFDALTGQLLDYQSDLNILRFFPGQDGHNYLLAGNNVIQWTFEGNTIQVIDIAEWDTSGRAEVVAPTQVGVRQDGTAWLLYTSPGGSSSLAWMTIQDEYIGSADLRVSAGRVIDMRDDLTTYICGGRSFNEEFIQCGALEPGVHEPLWELQLGNHGPVQGGFWQDGTFYLVSRDGNLFAIDESKQKVDLSPVSNQPVQPGLTWTYPVGEIITQPLFSNYTGDPSSLRLYLFSENNNAYAINSHGELIYKSEMPAGFIETERFRDEYFPPVILADGSVVIIGEGNIVFALDPEGRVSWEETLDANPYNQTLNHTRDEIYLTDTQAGLYVFNSQGLKWKYKSSAGKRTAGGAVEGPDGSIYYTVTPSSKGFVQAVSPDGQGLWATQVETGSFYHTPQVDPNGNLVFLRDDVIDAQSGQLLKMEVPVRVDEYIPGEDGNLYLRSGSTVLQWQYGEGGFEILNTISWNSSQFGRSQPFSSWVTENGLVVMVYRGVQVWINPDGTINATVRYPSGSNTLQSVDLERDLVKECDWQTGRTLECSARKIDSEKTVWGISIPDVPKIDYWNTTWSGDFLYILSENSLYAYYLGEPEPN